MQTSVSNKKKVLIISSEFLPNTGGIGNHAYNLALYLSKENYAVTVAADIINVDDAVLEKFRNETSFIFKPVTRKLITPATYISRLFNAFSAARKQDTIFCSGKFSLWAGCLLKFFFAKKKYIAIVHGSELGIKNKWLQKLTHFSLQRFNAIVAVSNYTKQHIPVDILQSIPVYIIPNGINLDEFPYTSNNAAIKHFETDPLQLITVGSVTERKGQENVINALPALSELYPNLTYHIVGKPVIKEKLQQLINILSLSNTVIFHGMVERTELIALLQKSDIKLMLSNHTVQGDFEGFGIAILEANALGKPVIGSNFSGITDAVQNSKTGILVDPKNNAEIVAAVNEIFKNYTTYSANAKLWAKEHSWYLIIKKYIAIIEG